MSKRTKSESNKATGNEVPFVCIAQEARSVFLVGSFNNWDPAATPMQRSEGAEWLAVVQLRAGRPCDDGGHCMLVVVGSYAPGGAGTAGR